MLSLTHALYCSPKWVCVSNCSVRSLSSCRLSRPRPAVKRPGRLGPTGPEPAINLSDRALHTATSHHVRLVEVFNTALAGDTRRLELNSSGLQLGHQAVVKHVATTRLCLGPFYVSLRAAFHTFWSLACGWFHVG